MSFSRLVTALKKTRFDGSFPSPRRRWYYGSGEVRPILSELRGTDGKHFHLGSTNDEPKVLEQTAARYAAINGGFGP